MSESPQRESSEATCTCWMCGKDLLGKSHTVKLDGSMLCDRCDYLERERQLKRLQRP